MPGHTDYFGEPPDQTYVAGSGYIGVRGDYQVSRKAYDRRGARFEIPHAPKTPIYRNGDEHAFQDRQPGDIIQIQNMLSGAGILKKHRKGVWDEASRRAMRRAMALGNQRGMSWTDAVLEEASGPYGGYDEGGGFRGGGGGGGGAAPAPTYKRAFVRQGFIPKPYAPPDYDSLKVSARQHVEKIIDRPLKEHEVILLANEMLGDYRRQHDVEMDVARRSHYAAQRAGEEEARVGAKIGRTVGAETELVVGHGHDQPQEVAAEQVDPEAEMVEFALRFFADRITAVQERAGNEQANQLMNAIMGNMSQMVGGR